MIKNRNYRTKIHNTQQTKHSMSQSCGETRKSEKKYFDWNRETEKDKN